ncbi:MAG: translation initiation factor IF-2 N-terminal domain-containing protein, partial [candidate division Zixibacteria bacterium]
MPGTSKRVYELAKDFKISSNAMLSVLKELSFEPKSHMSVATDAMVTAVRTRFAAEKQEAKKDMAQKTQAKAKAKTGSAPPKTVQKTSSTITSSGGIKVKDSTNQVTSVLRKIEKKNKKKERRRKKGRREVNKAEVNAAFKAT